jgi:hypothetical protein
VCAIAVDDDVLARVTDDTGETLESVRPAIACAKITIHEVAPGLLCPGIQLPVGQQVTICSLEFHRSKQAPVRPAACLFSLAETVTGASPSSRLPD